MGLNDLVPPARRWTIAASDEVVPFSPKMSKAERAVYPGRALVAEGPGGTDVPVLRLAWTDLATKADFAVDSVFALLGDQGAGSVAFGFGGQRHAVLVRAGDGWRQCGELVRDGKRPPPEGAYRYVLELERAPVGELGRRDGCFYWASPTGPGLVARIRPTEPQPPPVAQAEPVQRRSIRDAGAALAGALRASGGPPPAPRWLEATRAVAGTWDVWDGRGRALVTLCPPGGAHSTRVAVLPQPGVAVPVEAVLLAAFVDLAV